jgi:ribosomal protein L7/L12
VNISFVNVLVLALFVVGGGLVALMVTVTQRSYKKDEQSEHWVVYPTAKGATTMVRSHPGLPGDYAVVLDEPGRKPIHVIKEIRAITGLGLGPAKHLVESAPSTVLSGIDHATATAVHGKLAKVGAVVRVAEA